ncbi:MAG: hypothetical protein HYR88_00050 [Verrucomicrobia bacterium]|nr:hypothetical protein [Verrucomicrobiota bacterium]MBI3867473.1 hypothetical protein [Verrucomicrobiota bacterium]
MAWFKRKRDPISERAKDLTQQIHALERQIHALDAQASEAPPLIEAAQHPSSRAPLRVPASGSAMASEARVSPSPGRRDPHFEKVSQQRLHELQARPSHFNELGGRKFDLPAAWRRLADQLRGPAATNPKLVDLLAAGSLQGMRPLRYEKRIARRRFLIFLIGLLLLLWGLFAGLVRG